jgi:hypothetical protein
VQSVEDEDIIDDESIIEDELLWANPGTTAAAIEPAARKAAIKARCFFMGGLRERGIPIRAGGAFRSIGRANVGHGLSRGTKRR